MQKKIPMRQCVGCREMRPKRELVRVVKSPEGEITLDFKGKAPGRGAYVCPNVDCLKKARKAKALERGFDCQIPQEVYDALTEFTQEELGNGLGCNACALCAVLDPALAKAFVEALGTGEGNEAILQELTRQTMRVQKRRQEEKAHRNNVKHWKI